MTQVVRRRVLWLLLVALLAEQTLGLMHRIAHGGHPGAAAITLAQAQAHDGGGVWTDRLLAGHADDPACHVFDQVTQAGGPCALPATLPALFIPHHFLQWFQGEALARQAALFDARGPPPLR